ncbi:MAG: hypothetical protein JRJ83_14210 [Deltaproteobacteria bacterium]|nr:hypothetical protein [Deltaproteobacteria bacterium]
MVLNTGVEYYPRLLEAAALFKKGRAKWVVINGNRKTDVLRELEGKGFERWKTPTTPSARQGPWAMNWFEGA